MNKIKYLIFVPVIFSLFSCDHRRLPKRKFGDSCNITFVSNVDEVTCECPIEVPKDQDVVLHLNIAYKDCPQHTGWASAPTEEEEGVLETPNVEYTVNVGDINIYIGGELFNESFVYYAETSGYNTLTINKDYVVNDIEIRVNAKARERLFMYGLDFGNSIESRRKRSIDDTDPNHDITVEFETDYQNTKYPIHTLTGGIAFPVFEDDDVLIRFKTETSTLPDNICFRCNSRYAVEGLEFSREYGDDYKTCIVKIFHFVIRDHCSVVNYGEK